MDLIIPGIFSNEKHIECLFTTSNRSGYNIGESISGLNLGLNTDIDKTRLLNNYHLLFDKAGWQPEKAALARQVHGSHVTIAEKAGIFDKTDGLVTKVPDLPIGIQVADCAAVLIGDPHQKIIGAFHAGWRGAVNGIIEAGLEKMQSLGALPENCKAFISPCISQKNFEVGEEVASRFPDEFVDRVHYKKPHVDLKNFIVHQLAEIGLPAHHIEASAECTIENDRFYSYRREKKAAGRMLGLIKINS